MELLTGKIRPLYFKYLAAASGSALVASIFGMVDAMMVGQYHGPQGAAALSGVMPIWPAIPSSILLTGRPTSLAQRMQRPSEVLCPFSIFVMNTTAMRLWHLAHITIYFTCWGNPTDSFAWGMD